jgi:hypothetical protein
VETSNSTVALVSLEVLGEKLMLYVDKDLTLIAYTVAKRYQKLLLICFYIMCHRKNMGNV